MLDEHGAVSHVLHSGRPFAIRLHWKALRDTPNPVFGVGLYRSDGTYINGSNHHWRDDPIELRDLKQGEEGTVEISSDRLPLLHGQYYLTTFLYDHSKAAPTPIDHREHVLTFEVLDARRLQHGLFQIPSRWKVTRHGAGGTETRESLA